MSNTSDNRLPRTFYPLFILIACLILAAGRGDLWLDEIWSLFLAGTTSSAWGIIHITHDNNHLLNTLSLYLLGEQKRLYFYRLLPIICGIGSIYLTGLQARKWGRTQSVIAILLAGTSYPLILYFSEARGYSPAIFFALSTFIVLQKYEEKKTLLRLIAIWLFISLGILSHLTFILFLLSIFVYSVSCSFKQNQREKLLAGIYDLVFIYLIPFVLIAALYFLFVRHLTYGGGPIYNKMEVLNTVGSSLLGLPVHNILSKLGLVLLLLSSVAAIISLYKNKDPQWVFFVSILFFIPALLILTTKPAYLYFRYFLICFPFYYLLLSYLLGLLFHAEFKMGSYAVIMTIAALIIGQSLKIIPLLQYGRGNYKNALTFIVENSSNQPISIGSDHDFRNGMLLQYYSRFLPPDRQIKYISKNNIMIQKPLWLITHDQDLAYSPPGQIIINKNLSYDFMKKFSYSGVSGWNWFVYKLSESTQR